MRDESQRMYSVGNDLVVYWFYLNTKTCVGKRYKFESNNSKVIYDDDFPQPILEIHDILETISQNNKTSAKLEGV